MLTNWQMIINFLIFLSLLNKYSNESFFFYAVRGAFKLIAKSLKTADELY